MTVVDILICFRVCPAGVVGRVDDLKLELHIGVWRLIRRLAGSRVKLFTNIMQFSDTERLGDLPLIIAKLDEMMIYKTMICLTYD